MSNQQANTETLSFRIGLSGTFWDKRPEFSILVNKTCYAKGLINSDSMSVEFYEFTAELLEDQEYEIEIRLLNKTDNDVVKDPPMGEPYTIVKDMLLNIESIEVDGIELGTIKWTHSEFVPNESARPTLPGCVNLGWNGAYTLKFTTPFYLWLLENM